MPNYFASDDIKSVGSVESLCDPDVVHSDRPMGSRVDPKKRVVPPVRKLYHDWMVADQAAGSSTLEYSFRTFAGAGDAFQNQLGSLISSNSRRAACLAEGFHFRNRFPPRTR